MAKHQNGARYQVELPFVEDGDVIRDSRDPSVYADARFRVPNTNASNVFAAILSATLGGSLLPVTADDIISRLDHGLSRFKPDVIIEHPKGNKYFEVKVTNGRNTRFDCPEVQWRNYQQLVLLNMMQGSEATSADYAFFRLGNYSQHPRLHLVTNGGLVERINELPKKGLIVPMPLMYLLMTVSRRGEKNHTSSRGRRIEYDRRIPGSFFTTLFDEHIDDLLDEFPRAKDSLVENLRLRNLEKHRIKTKPIKINGHQVDPFNITKYSLSPEDHQAWLRFFGNNYRQLMNKIGIEPPDLEEDIEDLGWTHDDHFLPTRNHPSSAIPQRPDDDIPF